MKKAAYSNNILISGYVFHDINGTKSMVQRLNDLESLSSFFITS